MRFAESWKAVWEGRVLHISGTTDRFPNDWSTASLRREHSDRGDATVRYTLEFHRDKEPFCDKDLVGPVHHYETSVPSGASRVRVTTPDGQDFVEFELPRRRFWW